MSNQPCVSSFSPDSADSGGSLSDCPSMYACFFPEKMVSRNASRDLSASERSVDSLFEGKAMWQCVWDTLSWLHEGSTPLCRFLTAWIQCRLICSAASGTQIPIPTVNCFPWLVGSLLWNRVGCVVCGPLKGVVLSHTQEHTHTT